MAKPSIDMSSISLVPQKGQARGVDPARAAPDVAQTPPEQALKAVQDAAERLEGQGALQSAPASTQSAAAPPPPEARAGQGGAPAAGSKAVAVRQESQPSAALRGTTNPLLALRRPPKTVVRVPLNVRVTEDLKRGLDAWVYFENIPSLQELVEEQMRRALEEWLASRSVEG